MMVGKWSSEKRPRQHVHDSFLDGNTLAGLLLVEESCICAGVHVHGFTPRPESTP